jgi:molybdopterin converting factor small subunit
MHTKSKELVEITVELFGQAQLIANQKEIKIQIAKISNINNIAKILANNCSSLIGPVIKENAVELQSSYIANLNGATFLTKNSFELRDGDRILIFSSQAGG